MAGHHLPVPFMGRVREAGRFVLFLRDVTDALFPPYARGAFFFQQFVIIGVKSIPIVLIVGAFVGMVLAVMTYQQFSSLGIETMMGPFIAVPMVSQLGPILTALMVLCRVGSAMTAEIGTMRVTEQIDALQCFGVNPTRNLIVPRIVCCSLLLPALTVLSDVIGILGGKYLAIHVYGINEHYYTLQTLKHFMPFDIYTGIVKAFVFGLIISSYCCFKGFHSSGGATGVGRAIMEAVVAAFIAIIVTNFFVSLLASHIWHAWFA